MKFIEAFTEVMRRMGFLLPTEADLGWNVEKLVRENKKVFDSLAKS